MRKNQLLTIVFTCLLSFVAYPPLHAQTNQMLGNWTTVDDKTGEKRSIVNIYRASDGLYYGKITKMLIGPKDAKCTECKGEDHNAKLEGLIIIRGMQEEKGELRGGKVLDPESGKFYYGKIYLKDGKLVLRGSLDKLGALGRNQTWLRAK
ncbi:MAG: DUF2147 domain-containing protein [Paludibacteraceae bacterium]|nr:DUF2147 domain-containing protein [Paludibacteraceae bacterium]